MPFVIFLSCTDNKTLVKTTLTVEVIPEYQADTSLFILGRNIFKINQTFDLKNYQQDTVFFELETPSQNTWLNEIWYQRIKVFSVENQTKKSVDFEFSEKGIKCVAPSKNCSLEIEYYYVPDYVMFGGDGRLTWSVVRVASSWQSWYFTMLDIQFDDIQFIVPDDKKFFASLPQKIKKNKIHLDFTKIKYYGIAFLVVEPPYYQNFKIETGKSKFNIFVFKDINLTSDSTSLDLLYVPKDTVLDIENYKKYLAPLVNIEKLFDKNIQADIIDGDVSVQTAKMGQAFPLGKNNGFVIMDTAFWKNDCGLHEIIHLYNNVLPQKNDSAFYFFNESVTEFVCSYFYYSDLVVVR
ncbi:MAG: hypothetical protein LBB53_04265 [Prevotellaceae bacterium]|nr:hypothetical protein [Prevotellaceae bacterium]